MTNMKQATKLTHRTVAAELVPSGYVLQLYTTTAKAAHVWPILASGEPGKPIAVSPPLCFTSAAVNDAVAWRIATTGESAVYYAILPPGAPMILETDPLRTPYDG